MRTREAVTRATKRQLPTLLVAAALLFGYLVFAAVCDDCLTIRRGHIEWNLH